MWPSVTKPAPARNAPALVNAAAPVHASGGGSDKYHAHTCLCANSLGVVAEFRAGIREASPIYRDILRINDTRWKTDVDDVKLAREGCPWMNKVPSLRKSHGHGAIRLDSCPFRYPSIRR